MSSLNSLLIREFSIFLVSTLTFSLSSLFLTLGYFPIVTITFFITNTEHTFYLPWSFFFFLPAAWPWLLAALLPGYSAFKHSRLPAPRTGFLTSANPQSGRLLVVPKCPQAPYCSNSILQRLCTWKTHQETLSIN